MVYQSKATGYHRIATTEDINRTILYLSRSFSNAISKASHIIGTKAERISSNKHSKTTELYEYQVDFAYLINNIRKCPAYIIPKYVQETNDLITGINALVSLNSNGVK